MQSSTAYTVGYLFLDSLKHTMTTAETLKSREVLMTGGLSVKVHKHIPNMIMS